MVPFAFHELRIAPWKFPPIRLSPLEVSTSWKNRTLSPLKYHWSMLASAAHRQRNTPLPADFLWHRCPVRKIPYQKILSSFLFAFCKSERVTERLCDSLFRLFPSFPNSLPPKSPDITVSL